MNTEKKHTNYEIERKFLIRMPDTGYLEQNPDIEKIRICQTYLQPGPHLPAEETFADCSQGLDSSQESALQKLNLQEQKSNSPEKADTVGKSSNRRIRKWTQNGKSKYIYTSKIKLSAIKRLETEFEIDVEDYQRLMQEKDPDSITLEKTRYRIYENGFCFELDVFPFWSKQAYLEVELPSENTSFELPDFIEVIREVTEEEAYSNYALAHQIPSEDTCEFTENKVVY